MKWFRFYSEFRSDPKFKRMPVHHRYAFVILLCLASDGDPRGVISGLDDDDIAFELEMATEDWLTLKAKFKAKGLIHWDGDLTLISDWDTRQFASDSSAERVSRYRARQKQQECNVTTPESNVTETLVKRRVTNTCNLGAKSGAKKAESITQDGEISSVETGRIDKKTTITQSTSNPSMERDLEENQRSCNVTETLVKRRVTLSYTDPDPDPDPDPEKNLNLNLVEIRAGGEIVESEEEDPEVDESVGQSEGLTGGQDQLSLIEPEESESSEQPENTSHCQQTKSIATQAVQEDPLPPTPSPNAESSRLQFTEKELAEFAALERRIRIQERDRYLNTKYTAKQFEAWWEVNRYKVGKGAAKAAFCKLKPADASLEVLTEKIRTQQDAYLSNHPKDERPFQFFPHPATWLNQRRWEDEVPAAQSVAPAAPQREYVVAPEWYRRKLEEDYRRIAPNPEIPLYR